MGGIALESLAASSDGSAVEAERFGLAYWSSTVRGRAGLDEIAFARMVAHPQFGEACLQIMRETLKLQDIDPKLMRIVVDIRLAMLAFFVVYLDARSGITLAAIHDLCQELGLASPGRATALLITMRMRGYVVPDPAQTDRRTRRYVPSATIRAALARSFRLRGLAFALIEPEALRITERFDDRRIFNGYVTELASGLSAVLKRGDSSAVNHFAERNAGLGILFTLAVSGQPGDTFPPRLPVSVSSYDLAARFKVSRSHVARMLRDAENLGYLSRRGSMIRMEEPLRAALVEYQAANFFAYATCACTALEAVGETP